MENISKKIAVYVSLMRQDHSLESFKLKARRTKAKYFFLNLQMHLEENLVVSFRCIL
jgi:hypothetical protein